MAAEVMAELKSLLMKAVNITKSSNHTNKDKQQLKGFLDAFASLPSEGHYHDEDDAFLKNISHALDSLLPRSTNSWLWSVSPILAAYGVLMFASLFGNGVLCAAAARGRRLRTSSSIFLFNLAVADLLQTLVGAPLTLIRLFADDWPFGEFGCSVAPVLQIAFVFAATLTMTVMALDRYLVVSSPLRPRITIHQGVLAAALVWLVSIVLSIPHGVFHRQTTVWTVRKRVRCQAWFPEPASVGRMWLTVITFLLQFVLPVVITGCAYVAVARRIVTTITPPGASILAQKERRFKQTRRTLLALLLTVSIFTLCWLPINLYHILADLISSVGPTRHNSRSFLICHLIAVSSAALNPLVYCWLDEKVRKWAQSACKMQPCRNCIRLKQLRLVGLARYHSGRFELRQRTENNSSAGSSGSCSVENRRFRWQNNTEMHNVIVEGTLESPIRSSVVKPNGRSPNVVKASARFE